MDGDATMVNEGELNNNKIPGNLQKGVGDKVLLSCASLRACTKSQKQGQVLS